MPVVAHSVSYAAIAHGVLGEPGASALTGAVSRSVAGPGTIPDDFHPTSAVVCEFSGYTDDCGCALVRQTSGLGNFVAVVEQLNLVALRPNDRGSANALPTAQFPLPLCGWSMTQETQ
jgi:hypothetical protein